MSNEKDYKLHDSWSEYRGQVLKYQEFSDGLCEEISERVGWNIIQYYNAGEFSDLGYGKTQPAIICMVDPETLPKVATSAHYNCDLESVNEIHYCYLEGSEDDYCVITINGVDSFIANSHMWACKYWDYSEEAVVEMLKEQLDITIDYGD